MRLHKARQWALILGLLIVGIFLNTTLARRLPQFDLTHNRVNTLQSDNHRFLSKIDAPIIIHAYLQEGSDDEIRMRRLLSQMRRSAKHLSYKIVDMDGSPELAAQDRVNEYGTVVVTIGNRHRYLYYSDLFVPTHLGQPDFVGERALISSIRFLTDQRLFPILVMTGHGERSIDSAETRSLFRWSRMLEYDGWTVHPFNGQRLAGIPSQSIVVLAAPTYELAVNERLQLLRFIQAGGRCIVLGDFGSDASLNPLLNPMGIALGSQVISDPKSSYFKSPSIVIPILQPTPMTTPLITQQLGVVMPVSVSVNVNNASSKVPLLITSFGTVIGAIASYGDGGVVVFGDVDWVSNDMISTPGNRMLSLNVVRFLAGESLVSEQDLHEEIESSLILSVSQWRIFLSLIFAGPVCIFFEYWRRRWRLRR